MNVTHDVGGRENVEKGSHLQPVVHKLLNNRLEVAAVHKHSIWPGLFGTTPARRCCSGDQMGNCTFKMKRSAWSKGLTNSVYWKTTKRKRFMWLSVSDGGHVLILRGRKTLS